MSPPLPPSQYTPRTLTFLAVLVGLIGYNASVFQTTPTPGGSGTEDSSANVKKGLQAVAFVFCGWVARGLRSACLRLPSASSQSKCNRAAPLTPGTTMCTAPPCLVHHHCSYCMVHGPCTSMVRPHPVVWRLVHGVLVSCGVFFIVCVCLFGMACVCTHTWPLAKGRPLTSACHPLLPHHDGRRCCTCCCWCTSCSRTWAMPVHSSR